MQTKHLIAGPFFMLLIALPVLLSAQARPTGARIEQYQPGTGLRFTTLDGYYRFRFQAGVQSYVELKNYSNIVDTRFRVRRARIALSGEDVRRRISYRLRLDFRVGSGNDPDELNNGTLLDAFVRWQATNVFSFTFGQRSLFTDNRGLRMSSDFLGFVERSRVTSAFAGIRDFGLFIEGRHRLGNVMRLKSIIQITSGDGANAFFRNYGGLLYGGRLDWLPFGYFRGFGEFRIHDLVYEHTPKMSFGFNFSFNDGISSRRGRNSGDILYLNDDDEFSLPDYTKFGIDLLFKYRGLNVLAEWQKTWANVPTDITQRIRDDGSISTSFPEGVDAFVRGRLMLGSAFNIQAGYTFVRRFSVDVRYTHLVADANSFLNNAKFYSRPNYYSVAITKYFLNDAFKFQAAATYIDTSDLSEDKDNNPLNGDPEWIYRFLIQFNF